MRYKVFRFSSHSDVEAALRELAEGAVLVVVDNQLLPKRPRLGVRVIERDSRRVPGLQLAGVAAGFARWNGCPH